MACASWAAFGDFGVRSTYMIGRFFNGFAYKGWPQHQKKYPQNGDKLIIICAHTIVPSRY